jgi:DNA polymerase III gamma/tau subunit
MLTRLAELTRAGYGVEIGSATDAPQEAGMKATAAKLGNAKILSLRTMIASSLTEVRDVSLPKLWLESVLLEAAMGTQQPAPAPQPQVAYDAPRPQAVQPSPDRAAVVAERRAAEPGPKPPTATPIKAVPPSSDPDTTAASEIWQEVLDAITTMSRAASAKLAKTRIKECQNKTLFVAFQRVTDLETFQNSPKLMAAVQTEWTKAQSGTDFKLEFVQDDDQPQFISPMDEAVDLPAGGAKLAEIAKEVFEGF